jgi:hypothetical protein
MRCDVESNHSARSTGSVNPWRDAGVRRVVGRAAVPDAKSARASVIRGNNIGCGGRGGRIQYRHALGRARHKMSAKQIVVVAMVLRWVRCRSESYVSVRWYASRIRSGRSRGRFRVRMGAAAVAGCEELPNMIAECRKPEAKD